MIHSRHDRRLSGIGRVDRQLGGIGQVVRRLGGIGRVVPIECMLCGLVGYRTLSLDRLADCRSNQLSYRARQPCLIRQRGNTSCELYVLHRFVVLY